jgi:CheY-like chemotaxis protein
MSPAAASADATLLAGIKILVVEDSANMRELLAALLTTMGIGDIRCAENGEAGLTLFHEMRPDLVITDGMMQPMSGYVMTRAIRAMRDAPGAPHPLSDVPVLMLSGHNEPDIVEWARNEGVTEYIVKPVTPELLYERVLNAIKNPLHIVETESYRGPSPRRRLVPHMADTTQPAPVKP